MGFQQTLEDARFEVSIELYPDDERYQIYKPSCPWPHCWEVYHNNSTPSEEEVDMGCETLDDALEAVKRHSKTLYMPDERWRKYLDAIDTVCGECSGTEDECESCMVRKTRDARDTSRKVLGAFANGENHGL